MLAIRTILHPTDFSECSQYAFQLACAVAQAHGSHLHVLHIASHPVVAPVEGMPGHYREELTERLRGMRAVDPKVRVEPQLLFSGDPVGEILRVAKDVKPDLVIMGTHGRTGLRRLLMGSVAEEVLRRASCPVVTVKAPVRDNSRGESILAADRGMGEENGAGESARLRLTPDGPGRQPQPDPQK